MFKLPGLGQEKKKSSEKFFYFKPRVSYSCFDVVYDPIEPFHITGINGQWSKMFFCVLEVHVRRTEHVDMQNFIKFPKFPLYFMFWFELKLATS